MALYRWYAYLQISALQSIPRARRPCSIRWLSQLPKVYVCGDIPCTICFFLKNIFKNLLRITIHSEIDVSCTLFIKKDFKEDLNDLKFDQGHIKILIVIVQDKYYLINYKVILGLVKIYIVLIIFTINLTKVIYLFFFKNRRSIVYRLYGR